ncbi:MAG: WbqC family protein [bacterium]|nr:WbqC family protein [bacterium]
MKAAIMQPYFLPYIGYFQLFNAVDKFVIYDDVNFISRGWVNRNKILLNGNDHTITIPLVKASQNKKINEIEIVPDDKWKNKLHATIKHAYSKAPFYQRICPLLEEILHFDSTNLSYFLLNSIQRIGDYLSIETELIKSSSFFDNQELKGQTRILDIAKKLGSKHYINPIGGRDLYDFNYFRNSGIQLSFIQSNQISYNQPTKPLIPNLSILDVLMYNEKNNVKTMLDKYILLNSPNEIIQ